MFLKVCTPLGFATSWFFLSLSSSPFSSALSCSPTFILSFFSSVLQTLVFSLRISVGFGFSPHPPPLSILCPDVSGLSHVLPFFLSPSPSLPFSRWISLPQVAPRPRCGWLWLLVSGLVAGASNGEKGVRRWHDFMEQKKTQNPSIRVPNKFMLLPQEPQSGESPRRSTKSSPSFLIPQRERASSSMSSLLSSPFPPWLWEELLISSACHSGSVIVLKETLLHRKRTAILIKKHL